MENRLRDSNLRNLVDIRIVQVDRDGSNAKGVFFIEKAWVSIARGCSKDLLAFFPSRRLNIYQIITVPFLRFIENVIPTFLSPLGRVNFGQRNLVDTVCFCFQRLLAHDRIVASVHFTDLIHPAGLQVMVSKARCGPLSDQPHI